MAADDDITEIVCAEVVKLISNAATKHTPSFIVDVNRTCKKFIDQKITVVPPEESTTKEGIMYTSFRFVRNKTKHTFDVPISREYMNEHSEEYNEQEETHVDVDPSVNVKVGAGAAAGGSKGKKPAKKAKTPNPLPSADAEIKGSVGWKKIVSDKMIDGKKKTLRIDKSRVHGNITADYPSGKFLCTVKFKLRALKVAELKVEEASAVPKAAAIGVAAGLAGGAAGGAAIGAAAGIVIPGIGNLIGAVVGGLVGLAVGGGVAGGAGAGVGAAGGAIRDAVCAINMTANEIFKEGEGYVVDKDNKGYINCVINHQYIVDFDLATANPGQD